MPSENLASTPHSERLHDLQNEQWLLCVAIHDFPTYRAMGVEPGDYYAEENGQIARVAEAVHEEFGAPLENPFAYFLKYIADNPAALTAAAQAHCFADLLDPVPPSVADAEKLKRQRRGREAVAALTAAIRRIGQGDVDEGLSGAAEALAEGQKQARSQVELSSFRQLTTRWLERQDERQKGGGISLGLARLKQHIGTLMPGNLLVLGAQTGNGKTSLVQEILCAAADEGTYGALISMEDDEDVATTRWVAAFAGVPPKLFRDGGHRDVAMRGIEESLKYEGRVFFYDCIGRNEQDVMTVMTVAAQQGVRLVVVDYIGEVGASAPQQDRRNEMRWLVTRLKAHARRIGVALILVSQLSRPKDGQLNREPSKHDLKEAGDVENAAEYVLLLWREAEDDYAPVHVKLAKSKTGGTGRTWLMQREVCTERDGQRVPGSARLREVVKDRNEPDGYLYPVLEPTYAAILDELYRRR